MAIRRESRREGESAGHNSNWMANTVEKKMQWKQQNKVAEVKGKNGKNQNCKGRAVVVLCRRAKRKKHQNNPKNGNETGNWARGTTVSLSMEAVH